ncbi:type II secretion system F family protein [Candidatus Saccharibacteria bacterium]|nr:type II secretion system F family protein [Candidatus Saccharibacteria bacterium]
MAHFNYKAVNPAGKTVTGTIEAVDRNTALNVLYKDKMRPLTLTIASGSKKNMNINILGAGRVKSDALVVFTRQLSTMVSAGVPLLKALGTLQAQSESAALKTTLADVVKDVQGGMSLGDALGKHPKVFNDVYVNMVRAGEAAGILDDILKRVASQQERNATIRKKVKGAMTYPMVLIGITIGSFFVLMLFVVPKIGGIIKDLGGPDAELPALTQAMLSISDFLQAYWYFVFAGVIAGVIVLKRYISTKQGKEQFHALILKVPALGTIIKKVAVARFARTFASLMGAGVSVLEALKVTGRAIGNRSYEKSLEEAAKQVQNGKQLSDCLQNNPLFPAIVPQMLAVGEETGQTDTVLVKVADFYEEEVNVAIDGISGIIEPVMIVMMGGMVGVIAISVLGPISSISQNIK